MNYKEVVAAKKKDLKDGEMKRVSIEDTDVLLSQIDGKIYAVGARCPHYGANLEMGILSGDRIVCPWHHACFNAKTGDLEEPPASDALPRFEVKIDGEDVIVRLPEKVEDDRTPPMVKQDLQSDKRVFAIIGAGGAANAAAQTLREDEFKGRIVMVTYENRLPYDRPNLSKGYLQGKAKDEWMSLRSEDFYNEYDIELMLQSKVTHLDTASQTITLESGDILRYDALLLATGGTARTLNLPGADLRNIFTLRSYDDANDIIKASESASQVIIIGASFIGMETAHSLTVRKLPVTVIAPESVPFESVFGKEIGKLFQKKHEDNGVTFRLGTSVSHFEGDGTVKAVVLENGERIETDLVVIGVGVKPATDFLQDINLHTDGSVEVDKYLRTDKQVYAAGDIARFPDWRTGEAIRIEHWRTAEQQGRIAAHNMMGKQIPFTSVPFFWTTQAGLHIRYVGYVKDWDEIIIDGDVFSKEFIAYYVKNNCVLAVLGSKRDQEMAAIEELIRLKKMPTPKELHKHSVDLLQLL